MKITIDNLSEEFEKLLTKIPYEQAIKWWRQSLINIIIDPDTSAYDKETAEETYKLSANMDSESGTTNDKN